jgi:hypothetical protein
MSLESCWPLVNWLSRPSKRRGTNRSSSPEQSPARRFVRSTARLRRASAACIGAFCRIFPPRVGPVRSVSMPAGFAGFRSSPSIFAERLEATIARPFERRRSRLESVVHHLGLALEERPGQSFARRLLLLVSNDTILRVVGNILPTASSDRYRMGRRPPRSPSSSRWRSGYFDQGNCSADQPFRQPGMRG